MAKKKKTETAKAAAELATTLATPTPRVPAIKSEDLLSTGCTLLNMAFSGRPGGGVPKGNYLYFVGDSSSGKTWFCFNLYAEAAANPQFDGYRFVFDNAENGALMDVERYFGRRVRDRLEPPHVDKQGEPVYSETVEEFYYHLDMSCRRGPCIYILDSMDALNADADEEKFQAELHRYETGKGEVPGSMGMAKAKTNSQNINRVVKALRETGSILVVISQTRDKIGARFPTKTRSGGKALRFYAHLEAWTSVVEPITSSFRGNEVEVGATIRIDVQKNRVCGWEGKLEVPFIKQYGVDDLGGCIEYLRDWKHWKSVRAVGKDAPGDDKRKEKTFEAPEFKFAGTKEELIQLLQGGGEFDEWDLQKLTAKVWRDIQAATAPVRQPRYT